MKFALSAPLAAWGDNSGELLPNRIDHAFCLIPRQITGLRKPAA